MSRYGSAFERAPRNCTALGWCTLRRVSISDRKSESAISDDCLSDLTATMVPFHTALCTIPNSPSPASRSSLGSHSRACSKSQTQAQLQTVA